MAETVWCRSAVALESEGVVAMKDWLCTQRGCAGFLVLAAMTGLAACGGSSVGESCAKTGDCKSGMTCINQVCQRAGSNCPADTDCSGRECGPDPVCGRSCGTCEGNCEAGRCKVVCGDRKCGAGEDQCNCPGDCTGGCAGCCQGTVCKTGTSNSECGRNGAVCAACSGGKTCQSQVCGYYCGDGVCTSTPPGTETQCVCAQDCGSCAGCCQGMVCNPGTSNSECGKNGAVCMSCSGGKTCQQEGQCASAPWKDQTSGLTWQVTPTGGTMNWSKAKTYCAGLSLDGGGWYLPTIGELRSLIRGCPATQADGSCNIKEDQCLKWSCRDSSCDGCSIRHGPADGCYWPDEMQGTCSWYWSSSPIEDSDNYAWYVLFYNGNVNYNDVSHDLDVRCVRDAP
jgi:hypothetical protein